MSEPRNWDMLALYLANEASSEEVKEIEAWMDSDRENRVMVQLLRASFSISAAEDDSSDLNALWTKISQEVSHSRYGIARTSPSPSISEWMRHTFAEKPAWVPAAAVVAVLALAWIPYHFLWNSPNMIEVNVPFGERMTVDLQDGTRVVLDAGSQLQYPEQLADNSRHVRLRGQGYFKVSRDASRPFVVTAGAGEVEVLGTAFDIQSWSDAPVIVSVEEGRVKFRRVRGDAGQFVVLGVNQVSTLGSTAGPTSPTTVDVTRRMAWMRDEVFYDDSPLSEILDRLRRWHSVEFSVSDPALLDERLTIHVVKSDLQGSIDLLVRLLSLDVTRNGSSARLSRRSVESN